MVDKLFRLAEFEASTRPLFKDFLHQVTTCNDAAAQVVQELHKATRNYRLKQLSSLLVSIHKILGQHPVFNNPKSVCSLEHMVYKFS